MNLTQKIGLAVASVSSAGYVVTYIKMIRAAVVKRRVQQMIDDLERRRKP